MGSNICPHLIAKPWSSYATDLAEAPQSEGIYAIGFAGPSAEDPEVIYVGRSIHIRTRFLQHRGQNRQEIDKFVKGQFTLNGGRNLFIKWVEVENTICLEKSYLKCVHETLGYWPLYNLRHGTTCHELSPTWD